MVSTYGSRWEEIYSLIRLGLGLQDLANHPLHVCDSVDDCCMVSDAAQCFDGCDDVDEAVSSGVQQVAPVTFLPDDETAILTSPPAGIDIRPPFVPFGHKHFGLGLHIDAPLTRRLDPPGNICRAVRRN